MVKKITNTSYAKYLYHYYKNLETKSPEEVDVDIPTNDDIDFWVSDILNREKPTYDDLLIDLVF
ncbi:MAG: hypothetical protein KDD56_02305 [Bdellovibrionales bacterium]|nr:hypothetical protein [Bdellovibrionales bacterium]